MSVLLRLYVTTLNRHPLKTQALTTGINLICAFRVHNAANLCHSTGCTGRCCVVGPAILRSGADSNL